MTHHTDEIRHDCSISFYMLLQNVIVSNISKSYKYRRHQIGVPHSQDFTQTTRVKILFDSFHHFKLEREEDTSHDEAFGGYDIHISLVKSFL